jgi:hypothetical protein
LADASGNDTSRQVSSQESGYVEAALLGYQNYPRPCNPTAYTRISPSSGMMGGKFLNEPDMDNT